MAENDTFVWLVKSGTVQVWLETNSIHIQTMPSEGDECQMTRQDALEIATILYQLAQRLPDEG